MSVRPWKEKILWLNYILILWPLSRRDICNSELSFSSKWNERWLEHTTRLHSSRSSDNANSEPLNPLRLALRNTIFMRLNVIHADVITTSRHCVQNFTKNYWIILDNTAKRCGIMAVLHITYYDVWPWPLTWTTNVATVCKNEKYPNNMTQSRQWTKTLTWIQDQLSCTPQTRHNGKCSDAIGVCLSLIHISEPTRPY